MKPIFIRPASHADLRELARNLTPADAAEVYAATGTDPLLALPASWNPDFNTVVGGLMKTGEVAAGWGVDPVPGQPDVGLVWMLVTPVVEAEPATFVPALKRTWGQLHQRYPILTNYADARNERHLRLLRWLGCSFIREVPLGPFSVPFVEFVSVRY